MKKWLFFVALFAVSALFVECGKGEAGINDPPPGETPSDSDPVSKTPKLVMATPDLTFTIEDSGLILLFEVNVDWTIRVEYEGEETGWLTVTPEKGQAGTTELTLIAETNSTETARRAIVCIVYGDRTYRLEIIQEGLAGKDDGTDPKLVMITPWSSFSFWSREVSEEKAEFTVNRDWEVAVAYETGDAEWLTVSPESGAAGEVELTMLAADNPSGADRKAQIIISFGGKTHTLTAFQDGLNLSSDFDPYFAQELERRGYIDMTQKITPEEVKGIKILQMHGSWNEAEQKYKGRLTSLRGIEYFESLTELTCWGNQLTELDVSRNAALIDLRCYNNLLTSLDVSKNTALQRFSCHSNLLTELDVSRNPALVGLVCGNNRLTELDVTRNPELRSFLCEKNQIRSLDLANNPLLKALWCGFNQLSSIDISRNPKVSNLQCFHNPGEGAAFPIFCWFDNETIPRAEEGPSEDRKPLYMYTTESWIYEGRQVTPDYRKVD